MSAYYNEIDPAAAHVLRHLISHGVIAPGEVDTRSIKEVHADDLKGFTQCHFFAGGGLWSIAARLAGLADDRPLWTGSCPCQPFSVAGKGAGADDPRHLWPDFFRLIRAARPPIVLGEQVAGAAGYGWFDGVAADLESEGFAARTVDIPACAMDAPHIRQRLYWAAVGNSTGAMCEGQPNAKWLEGGSSWRPDVERANGGDSRSDENGCGIVALTERYGFEGGSSKQCRPSAVDASNNKHRILPPDPALPIVQKQPSTGHQSHNREDESLRGRNGSFWSDAEWIICHDDKARRAKPGIRLLVDGLPGRVDLWRIGGNAIVPQVAAEVIAALMDVLPEWGRA